MRRELIDQTIQVARGHWQIAETATLIAQRENSVFRVETENGLAALRIHRPGYRTLGEIQSELLWMDMLAKNDIPVPEPIPAHDGALIKFCNGKLVDLLSWIDGTPLNKTAPTSKLYRDLGVLLARMHNVADQWTLPEYFERPTWDLVGDNPLWDRFWKNPGLSRVQEILMLQFRDDARIAIKQFEAEESGLIHADLVPDNVLINGKQLFVIDFDDGGYGHRLFDLATITHRSKRNDAKGVLAKAAVSGYTQLRDIDVPVLPFFEALRACTYVGWNISRIGEEGARERNARFITEAERAIAVFYDKRVI